ncbi:MAG: hypothetical protein DWP98_06690 [Bacteroidetes bacterium]|nr:MAG: hypothetical protein DWP98_06690 [Bacteroidota bacterium]
MIISHKHKFIFIKTRKTAGTSIEIALSKICGDQDVISPISHKDELYRQELGFLGPQNFKVPFKRYTKLDWYRFFRYRKRIIFYHHMPATEIKRYVGDEVWDGYYKFTFDRNPYDKVVSLYYYYGGAERYGTFENFIKTGDFSDLRSFELYSIRGQVIFDDLFKFEELEESISVINNKLGLSSNSISLPTKKTKGGSRKVKDYKELINDDVKNIIDVCMAREIKLLDYKF